MNEYLLAEQMYQKTLSFRPSQVEKIQAYLTALKEGDIRYIVSIDYDMTAEIPLKIKYVDNGGNLHFIGFGRNGMQTYN